MLAHPTPARVDVDRAIRKGRRRRQAQVAATLGATVAVVSLAVSQLWIHHSPAIPSAEIAASVSAAALARTHPAVHLVTSELQLEGQWTTTDLFGRDVSGVQDTAGRPLTLAIARVGDGWGWIANDGCNSTSGTLTVDADGLFKAATVVTTTKGCLKAGILTPENVEAVQKADGAVLDVTTAGATTPELVLMSGTTAISRYALVRH